MAKNSEKNSKNKRKIAKNSRENLKIAGRTAGYCHGWGSVPMVRINIPTVRRKIPTLRRKFPRSEKNSHAWEKFRKFPINSDKIQKIQIKSEKFR